MASNISPSQRFVRRVHRRFVVARALEQGGIGVLVACSAALPLVGVLLWRGQAAVHVAVAALVIGAVAGLMAGMLRRPTPLAAALKADRQLRLADLFSSALALSDRWDDPWAAAVLAAADARAAELSPAAVLLNRFGARAWGGITLAAVLVLVLSLVPVVATETRAADSRSRSGATGSNATTPPEQIASAGGPDSRRFTPQADPQDEDTNRGGADDTSAAGADQSTTDAATDHRPSVATDPNGHGTGASQSKPPKRSGEQTAVSETSAHQADSTGRPSAGAGGSASAAAGSETSPSGVSAGAGRSTRIVPPWQTGDWGAQAQHVLRELREGRVPDAYGDVIRGYFDQQKH